MTTPFHTALPASLTIRTGGQQTQRLMLGGTTCVGHPLNSFKTAATDTGVDQNSGLLITSPNA